MSTLYSRRDVLGAGFAAGVLPILPRLVRAASPVPKRLVAGTRVLEVNGRPAKVFGLSGPDGRPGQRVEIDLVNHSMMAHPMHLHGHTFQVIAIDGRAIQGAVRDTVLVTPMMGRIRIAFDADNPG